MVVLGVGRGDTTTHNAPWDWERGTGWIHGVVQSGRPRVEKGRPSLLKGGRWAVWKGIRLAGSLCREGEGVRGVEKGKNLHKLW